jgi:hypothetical protein
MFTGIVEELGAVISIDRTLAGTKMTVLARKHSEFGIAADALLNHEDYIRLTVIQNTAAATSCRPAMMAKALA